MTEDHGHGHETVEGPGYCPNCGTALEAASSTAPAAASGRRPPACPSCDFVRWENPKLATGVVIEQDGAILLVRRNHDPMYGFWSFPSGFVDRGESVEEAAQRETLEEAGVEVEIEHLLGVYSMLGRPGGLHRVRGPHQRRDAAAGPRGAGGRLLPARRAPRPRLPPRPGDHRGVAACAGGARAVG